MVDEGGINYWTWLLYYEKHEKSIFMDDWTTCDAQTQKRDYFFDRVSRLLFTCVMTLVAEIRRGCSYMKIMR